jgi:plasmid stability protein
MQTLTLDVPDAVYSRLLDRAQRLNRSVELELLDVISTAVGNGEQLASELEEALDALAMMTDDELWNAARNRLARETSDEIRKLHDARQKSGLTSSETDALAQLMRQYDKALLVRARAAALLKSRGHDVQTLLNFP